jgi:hypothetical protein
MRPGSVLRLSRRKLVKIEKENPRQRGSMNTAMRRMSEGLAIRGKLGNKRVRQGV